MRPSVRQCIACRERDSKEDLLRFVYRDELVVWDRVHRLPGRGVYLHPREECMIRALDPKRWARGFRLAGDVRLGDGMIQVLREVRKEKAT